MKQSRSTSLIKSLVSTGVGFVVAYVANMLIMPWFGLELSHSANFILTCIYTVISIARGFMLERIFEAMGWRTRMSAFALAVLAERQRQVSAEGYTTQHDDEHEPGELAVAAATYALRSAYDLQSYSPLWLDRVWPWGGDDYKPQGFRRNMVKAAALIIAEGERHDRNRNRKNALTFPKPEASPEPSGAA